MLTFFPQIEQTAVAVLNMFPDLILAVEEAEPQLANDFFDMVRQWVGELLSAVNTTQGANKASIDLVKYKFFLGIFDV